MFITPEKKSKTSKVDSKVIWYSSWRRIFQHFNRHNSRPPNVSLEDFFEHFRNLTSDSSSTYISIANYLDTDSPIFESLDTKIRPLEIDACIRKLKKHKCAGKDNLINEYFSEFSDIILPILVDFLTKYSIQEYFQRHGRKQLLYLSKKRKYERSRELQRNQHHQ